MTRLARLKPGSPRILALLAFALGAGVAPVTAQSLSDAALPRPTPARPSDTENQTLRNAASAVLLPGDVIRVNVWRQPELSGDFEIMGDGTIAHPLYREIRVADREVVQVEAELRQFLRGYIEEPSFVVEGFFRIPVGGEVRLPDLYTVRPETTVARAIALAGGPTERANLERVRIRRGNETLTMDLRDPAISLADAMIRSGDEIVIERRTDILREYVAPSASVIAALAALLRLTL